MISFIFSFIFMILGFFMLGVSIFGNFKYSFVLNRMQVASISDTLGALFIIIALVIYTGFSILGIKLILVLTFMWFANPVASHFLAKSEIISDDKIQEKCEVVDNDLI